MNTVKSKYNIGWALLRPLLCFLVILEHCWVHEQPPEKAWQIPFDMLLSISVPSFMFMSFYLVEKHLTSGDPIQLRKRAWRIAWPLIGWAVIYFAVLAVASHFTKLPRPEPTDLLWQAATGHSPVLNPSMWFQAILLVLTVALFYIIRIAPKRVLVSLSLLLAGSLLFVWSGLNERLFGDLRVELRYPLGRTAEMIPFAVLGYAAARYDILERSRRYSKWLFPLFLLLTVVSVWLLSGHKEGGFGYSALFYLPASLCLVVAMWHAPFGNLGPRAEKVLLFISSFTLCIYCLHRLAFVFVRKGVHLAHLDIGYFHLCVLTYIASFIVAYLMSRLPWKWVRRLVE